ncbi:unnamed protein product [Penicillium nalgiovense]|uniref:Uncharacterized protein n=2 Tax=Penicillium TaxID=5073 RepID=A0A9W4HM65_PENNA|nr:unnamed protein product [Penicillium nalgiovense]CDM32616.1 Actin cortical patch SUR7/pH-response regulator PalI [Penicillium roqueforti FM164]CAG8004621.1 unnamed protein product [Penicillium nalgiovense]CAG8008585.1 unnamed protein product [Penicillium nalgiovense]CAG8032287.1 unnamed protein product [Penicillium nalgiovense]
MAFILVLICVLAGSYRHFLATADIVTIHLPSPPGGNMPQLLSIHVMSICRGSKNDITGCSFLRVPVHFLPIPVSANMQGVPSVKHEIAWPEYVMDRLATLAQTSRLMSIFYLIATGASGLSSSYWISSFRRGNLSWHVHTAPAQTLASHPDMPPSLVEFLSLVMSTFCMCFASTIASIISEEFVYLINTDGNPYGVWASHGNSFLKLSWAATTLQFLVVVESFILILKRRIGCFLCDKTSSSLVDKCGN